MTTHSRPRRWAKDQIVADYLSVHLRTVHNMTADGRIKAYRLGSGVVRYDLNEIDAALEASA